VFVVLVGVVFSLYLLPVCPAFLVPSVDAGIVDTHATLGINVVG
jgi:hypothetical protein